MNEIDIEAIHFDNGLLLVDLLENLEFDGKRFLLKSFPNKAYYLEDKNMNIIINKN